MKTVADVWLQTEPTFKHTQTLALPNRLRLQLANCCAAALDMSGMADELMALQPAEAGCDCAAQPGALHTANTVWSLHE